MSLLSAAERLAAIDRSAVVFGADLCLHSKDKFSECAVCYEVCPAGAIRSGKPPVFMPEECQTCLACLPICPMGAFTADDDVPALLNAASHLDGGTLELICGHNSHPDLGADASATGLRIKQCLAGLGTGTYAELAAFGFDRIQVRCESCTTCKWAALKTEIERQTRRANKFLSAWGEQQYVETIEEILEPAERDFWETSGPPVSRRELFKLIANRSQRVMARAMENVSSGSEKRPGRDRTRLIGAVAHLPALENAADRDLDGFGFASVHISESCTACAACAKACPTGALSFTKTVDGKGFSLDFSARKCVDCDVCVHVCAASAIETRDVSTLSEIFVTETVNVFKGALIKCERCGAPIAGRPGVTFCQVCEFRSKNPFGSMLPKAVQTARNARSKGASL